MRALCAQAYVRRRRRRCLGAREGHSADNLDVRENLCRRVLSVVNAGTLATDVPRVSRAGHDDLRSDSSDVRSWTPFAAGSVNRPCSGSHQDRSRCHRWRTALEREGAFVINIVCRCRRTTEIAGHPSRGVPGGWVRIPCVADRNRSRQSQPSRKWAQCESLPVEVSFSRSVVFCFSQLPFGGAVVHRQLGHPADALYMASREAQRGLPSVVWGALQLLSASSSATERCCPGTKQP